MQHNFKTDLRKKIVLNTWTLPIFFRVATRFELIVILYVSEEHSASIFRT